MTTIDHTMKKKSTSRKRDDSIMLEASAYLESWGRCPDLYAEARLIGRLKSTLAKDHGGHCGIEAIAALVESALHELGEDAKMLAKLLYRDGLPNSNVAQRMGISPTTLEKRVVCIKVAAFVIVKTASSKTVDNIPG